MGRRYTFMDREFGSDNFDDDDDGDFTPNLVFVAMPFDAESLDVYSAVKDECEKLDLNATRVDENVGAGFIIKEIVDHIEDAEFLIFDLTKERPNVYYELGYAHGVGNESCEILLIAKQGTQLHFDIAPFRVHFYRSTEHLRSIVANNLSEMIRKTR